MKYINFTVTFYSAYTYWIILILTTSEKLRHSPPPSHQHALRPGRQATTAAVAFLKRRASFEIVPCDFP